MTINFISAENSGIRLDDTVTKETFWSDNVDGLADVLRNRGAECLAHSSSMDFAAENGFADDDGAWALFRRALTAWGASEWTLYADALAKYFPYTDREKFDAWIKTCPVPILKRDDCAYGYIEVHVKLSDEDDD